MSKAKERSGPAGEALVRLYYGLTRPGDASATSRLLAEFRTLVGELFYAPGGSDWDRGGLLALVLQTRDVAGGKGEYALFYLLMGELFLCTQNSDDGASAELTAVMLEMMHALVAPPQGSKANQRPYGSWKDYRLCLSHLCELAGEAKLTRTVFFQGCVTHFVEQLREDELRIADGKASISLVGKWAPRERNKRHGWQAKYIAAQLYAEEEPSFAAVRGRLARYRQLVSNLNRQLRTVQVAQCAGRWSDIDFSRDVTASTLRKQGRAFQYPEWDVAERTGSPRHEDRLECRRHYLGYLRDCAQGSSSVKGAGLSPRTLVRDAIAVTEDADLPPKEAAIAASALDLQWWEGRGEGEGQLGPVVPIVDTSCTMSMDSDDPLCAAIGLGVRMAESSTLGRRLITFGTAPTWVNLEDEDTLTNAVRKIRTISSQGGDSDVLGALELVANACIEAELDAETVAGLCLVILSDADDGSSGAPLSLHARVAALFWDAGLRSVYRTGFRTPHLVYWGLRTRQQLPCSSTESGVSLVSGYHLRVLETLCTSGASGLGVVAPTPESALGKTLAGSDRYTWVWGAAARVPRPEASSTWLW
jgi:hypothetical protein